MGTLFQQIAHIVKTESKGALQHLRSCAKNMSAQHQAHKKTIQEALKDGMRQLSPEHMSQLSAILAAVPTAAECENQYDNVNVAAVIDGAVLMESPQQAGELLLVPHIKMASQDLVGYNEAIAIPLMENPYNIFFITSPHFSRTGNRNLSPICQYHFINTLSCIIAHTLDHAPTIEGVRTLLHINNVHTYEPPSEYLTMYLCQYPLAGEALRMFRDNSLADRLPTKIQCIYELFRELKPGVQSLLLSSLIHQIHLSNAEPVKSSKLVGLLLHPEMRKWPITQEAYNLLMLGAGRALSPSNLSSHARLLAIDEQELSERLMNARAIHTSAITINYIATKTLDPLYHNYKHLNDILPVSRLPTC